MDGDEREIFQFLKTWGGQYIAAMEICRRASSRKRFHDDPNWAKLALVRMAERGILESDIQGRYRIKPLPRRKHKQQWVSPEIAKILQDGGVDAGADGEDGQIADDEYYENL